MKQMNRGRCFCCVRRECRITGQRRRKHIASTPHRCPAGPWGISSRPHADRRSRTWRIASWAGLRSQLPVCGSLHARSGHLCKGARGWTNKTTPRRAATNLATKPLGTASARSRVASDSRARQQAPVGSWRGVFPLHPNPIGLRSVWLRSVGPVQKAPAGRPVLMPALRSPWGLKRGSERAPRAQMLQISLHATRNQQALRANGYTRSKTTHIFSHSFAALNRGRIVGREGFSVALSPDSSSRPSGSWETRPSPQGLAARRGEHRNAQRVSWPRVRRWRVCT